MARVFTNACDYVCGKCHNAFKTEVELEELKLNDKHEVNN